MISRATSRKGREQNQQQHRNDEIQPILDQHGHPLHPPGGNGDESALGEFLRLDPAQLEVEDVRQEAHHDPLLLAVGHDLGNLLVIGFDGQADDHLVHGRRAEQGRQGYEIGHQTISRS